MIFKIINFAVFLGLLIFFAKKPVKDYLSLRYRLIKETVDLARSAHDTAKKEELVWSERLLGLKNEINNLIENYKQEGEAEKKYIVDQAEKYAIQLKVDSERFAEQETTRAISEIKKFIAFALVELAKKKIVESMSSEDQLAAARKSTIDIEASL